MDKKKYEFKTNWDREKVEALMNKYGWEFESTNKCLYQAFINTIVGKERIRLCVNKTYIEIYTTGAYILNIKTYEKLEERIAYYTKMLKNK
jgi:hypothetical protein